ncbi:MAG: hypothetical protein ACRCX7_10030 [Cetobacterium sp.]|uniref:hypothetical protein n=1 Tax=Cetobacterium sp. TaxID=2071632 RepID=UPI003F3BDE6F
MDLINKNMSYEEIFDILTENGFRFGREYYDKNDKKLYEYYKNLPNHSCWIYYPHKNSAIGYNHTQSVEEFVHGFNQFVDYMKRCIKEDN